MRAMPSENPPVPARRRRRTIAIVASIAVLATGSAVGAALLMRDPKPPVKKIDLQPLASIGASAEETTCRDPERPEYQGRTQIGGGQKHPPYSSDPPSSGWYVDDVQAGYYHQVLPDENVLAIPAKGGVAIYTSDQDSTDARIFFNRAHRNDLIVVRDTERVQKGVIFVAWGYVVRCDKFSAEMAILFLERYSQGKALVHVEPTAKSEF